MQELVKITTNAQGASVVSARELYEYLGLDLSQWSRWSKKNIVNNIWAKEMIDWRGFDMMSSSNNGSMTTDYTITLEFAKRLAMLARTDKGEEIRRYFITQEERLRQLSSTPLPSTTDQLLSQLLTNQQQQLDHLRAEVDQIKASLKQGPVAAHQSNTMHSYGIGNIVAPTAPQSNMGYVYLPVMLEGSKSIRPFTAAERSARTQLAIHLREEGKSNRHIGRILGVSEGAVRKWFKSSGLVS